MRIAMALVLFFSTSLCLTAQLKIETTPQVQALIADADVVHVFTARIDKNFDGVQDDGDSPAQWHIVNIGSLQITSTLEFPWASVTSSRPALDIDRGLVYIGVGDSVWAYTSRTQVRGSEPIYSGPNVAIGFDRRSSELYVSHRPSFTDPGTIIRVNIADATEEEFTSGVNPQQTVGFTTPQFTEVSATICEGGFGQADGSLTFIDGETVTSLELGDTPNHMAVDANKGIGYVAMTGSHEIAVVDMITQKVRTRYPTGTTGFDGPREVAISPGFLFATSYASKIHVFDRNSGAPVGTVALEAKADPITFVGSTVWVGLAFDSESFSPVGGVIVYPLNVVSVAETMQELHTKKALLVTSSTVSLPTLKSESPLAILDLQGNRLTATMIDKTNTTIDISGLTNGTYIVNDGSDSVILCVVR